MNHAVLIENRIAFGSQRATQGDVGIKLAPLIEVHNTKPFGAADMAVAGREFSSQKTQQGGFAAAVRPDQTGPHSGGEDEIQI